MKRFSLFLAICLAVTTFSFATTTNPTIEDDPIVRVKVVDAKIFQINLANLQKETTNVKLTNLRGTTYFKETIRNHNGYGKKINIDQIPNGRYVLTITHNKSSVTKVIYIDDDAIRVSGQTQ